ncbi:MAG: aminotransferase class I/II-fold pyridoxal phosphate-dependent enzyme, partial [Anaerobacillus sp.]
ITWSKLRNHHLTGEFSPFSKIYNYMNEPSFINLCSGSAAPELCIARSTYDLIPFTTRTLLSPTTTNNIAHSMCNLMDQTASSSQMILTSGLEQSLLITIKCFLNPGDTIAVEEHVNYSHLNMLFASGIHIVWFSTERPLTDQFLQKEKVQLVVTNSLYDHSMNHSSAIKKRKKLLSHCEKFGIPILEIIEAPLFMHSSLDNLPSYFELGIEQKIVLQIGHLTGIAPGINIGWILGPENVRKRLQDVQIHLCLSPPPVLLELAENILNSEEILEHFDFIMEELNARKNDVLHKLSTLRDHISILGREDPTCIWFDFTPSLNQEEIFEALLEANVLLVPFKLERGVRMKLPLFCVNKEELLEGTSRLIGVLNRLHIKQFAEIY